MINQGISSNARCVVISFCKAAINHHQFAARLNRVLALSDANWHVAVDDVPVLTFDAKFVHDVIAHVGVVA